MSLLRVLAVTLATLVVGSTVGYADSLNTFDAGVEGWTIADFVPAGSGPMTYFQSFVADHAASQGNPGGFIYKQDPSGYWFWFSAPAPFTGDQTGAIGGTLSFDLRMNNDPDYQAEFPAVMIVGESETLFWNAPHPLTTWTRYSVELSAASGWLLNDYVGGSAPTEPEFATILSNVTGLYISGDWGSHERTDLDNVRLDSAPAQVPEPSTLALLGLCGVGVVLVRLRRGS